MWMFLMMTAQAVACGSGEDIATLNEVDRVRAGTIDVVLLSAHPSVRPGKDNYVIEFRSADGATVDVGQVKATASMPMPGMAPMVGGVDITGTDTPGRYAVASNLSMVGDWRLALEWAGPAGSGSVNMSLSVQP
jgi:hypothetical protein